MVITLSFYSILIWPDCPFKLKTTSLHIDDLRYELWCEFRGARPSVLTSGEEFLHLLLYRRRLIVSFWQYFMIYREPTRFILAIVWFGSSAGNRFESWGGTLGDSSTYFDLKSTGQLSTNHLQTCFKPASIQLPAASSSHNLCNHNVICLLMFVSCTKNSGTVNQKEWHIPTTRSLKVTRGGTF